MWNVQEPVLLQQGNEYTISIQHGMGDGVSYPLWKLYLSNTAKTGKDACPFTSGHHEPRLSIDDGILPAPMDGFEFTSLISVVGEQGTSSLSFEFDRDNLVKSDALVVDDNSSEAKIAFCVLFALQTDHRIVNARELALDIIIRLNVGVGEGEATESDTDEQQELTIDLPEPPLRGHEDDPNGTVTKQQEENIMDFEEVLLPASSASSTKLVTWIGTTVLALLFLW
jgi:hypothetical protein